MFLSYFLLGLAAFFPVVVSVGLYYLEKNTKFKHYDYKLKQLLYGLIFGVLAILGTELGVPLNGAQANCRDACVLIAGLLFGSPAGIIAGFIGGIERFFAVYWGVGEFTRWACSISTIIAGFYAALLRKFLFENKKPTFLLALAIGIVMEVFHLTMVFITNMDNPEEAMRVVRVCTAPMVIANGLSVMLGAMAISFVSKDKIRQKQSKVKISQTIQRWLLITVVLAFASTSYFVYSLQDRLAFEQANLSLNEAISEIDKDLDAFIKTTNGKCSKNDFDDEIKILIKNRQIGSTGYLIVVDNEQKIVSFSNSAYGDAVIDNDKKLKEDEIKQLEKKQTEIDNLLQNDILKLNLSDKFSMVNCVVNGENSFVTCDFYNYDTNNYKIISVLPIEEALQMRNIALYVNTFMEILVFAILFGLIYLLIKKVVVNKIMSINISLNKITNGDLNEIVDVRTNQEFASLSDDINSTVGTLKRLIDEASARIDKELKFAKDIQTSALPNIFPAFPNRRDFDIYATMDPAKEVGGDFYDFYITHDNTLNFLIADVSGKGIPAAMFMMRAKTELKTLTESDVPLSEVFTRGNIALCEGNDAGMFVTAWQCSVDLSTGRLSYVNAGHNPPLIYHKNGEFEYLKTRCGFILAGMEGVKYKSQELYLNPGDKVFLYTDGVTEATNCNNELYGEERLLSKINTLKDENISNICHLVKKDVDEFVGDAPQFDDITMVAFEYLGNNIEKTFVFQPATLNDITDVTEKVESELQNIDCSMKSIMQINVAIDEIFSNKVRYAYGEDGKGTVTVIFIYNKEERIVTLQFIDSGVPYDPLEKDDPDITLSAEDRQIGGLGILMVKKTMDSVDYKYDDGKNILTLKKKI